MRLSLFGLLAGACSSVKNAPDADPGSGGAGGSGDDPGCVGQFGVCVSSCASATPDVSFPFCDASGVGVCGSGTVFLSSCASDACARGSAYCCDDTTGAIASAACNAGGLRDACGAGTHPSPTGNCFPSGVTTTNCYDLSGTSCSSLAQRCMFSISTCACVSADGGSGGLSWSCQILPSP
jgi:hypothetical protein